MDLKRLKANIDIINHYRDHIVISPQIDTIEIMTGMIEREAGVIIRKLSYFHLIEVMLHNKEFYDAIKGYEQYLEEIRTELDSAIGNNNSQ